MARYVSTLAMPHSVDSVLNRRRHDERVWYACIVALLVGLTPLITIVGASIGFQLIVGAAALIVTLVCMLRWPVTGFFVLVASVVLIEQEPLGIPVGTDRIPIFHWPAQLSGFVERPVGLVILFTLLLYIAQRIANRKKALEGGAFLGPFLGFCFCVLIGVGHGLTSGGTIKIVVVEVRPFVYMLESYLLAYNLVSHWHNVRTMVWIVIFGSAVKSLQTIYVWAIVYHGATSDKRELVAHEESFFFAALLLLLLLFYLHTNYRPQKYAALLVSPLAIFALILNQRRTDYIALVIGALVAWILVIVVRPDARKRLVVALAICAVVGSAYVAAFYKAPGSFAKPAHAVVSAFYPDPQDVNSNLYRQIENFDLKYTLKQSPIIGYGFGKPFLQPLPLANILSLDPYYLYVPHNTVYWIWMRLGIVGFFAFWYLMGSFVIRGVHVVRGLKDPYLQMFGIYCVAIVFMQVIVGYADYQFFFYRNVIYLGLLVGILLKLPVLDKTSEAPRREGPRGVAEPAVSLVGR